MKKSIILVICLFISACASSLNVKSNNPATVTFRFKTVDDYAVLTFWRKIEYDGTKSSRFSIGVPISTLIMNGSYPKYYSETKKLDPGTYFLDSFQVPVSARDFCVSQKGHYMTRNGWDDANGEPFYMSFTVKEGQDLQLPIITISYDCTTVSYSGRNNVLKLGSKLKVK